MDEMPRLYLVPSLFPSLNNMLGEARTTNCCPLGASSVCRGNATPARRPCQGVGDG